MPTQRPVRPPFPARHNHVCKLDTCPLPHHISSQALPDWLNVPASMALPWGTFERVLREPSNAQVRGGAGAGVSVRVWVGGGGACVGLCVCVCVCVHASPAAGLR